MKDIALMFCSLITISLPGQELGIINNVNSPHVKLRSINIGDCHWTSGFWADKFKICEETMVPHMGSILKGDVGHAYHNFKIVAGMQEGLHQGTNWHDGDFYKWMESAMYVYGVNRDVTILEELDEIIAVIGKAQATDGYLHTATMLKGIERFSNRQQHEMYNFGHLLTAACVHHRISGQSNLLTIARKYADYVYRIFQPRPERLARFGFNPTQISGLVELYRTTNDDKYLDLAETFINMRGQNRHVTYGSNERAKGDMVQDRTPFRQETEAVGHAVLAMYLYIGVADVYAETGEEALLETLERLWTNVVDKKMYITGALGQAHHGASSQVDFVHEAFIDEYMMPNFTAYNETCANVTHAMFNWRMLGIMGESKYADIMELVLYNSALSGIGLAGKDYFYTNPLRMCRVERDYSSTESPVREPYIDCFCCPPNLVRTIAKVSGWAYGKSSNGIAVNIYGGNRLNSNLLDGTRIELEQHTQYPWDGKIKIQVKTCKSEPFDLLLRIPKWTPKAKISVNGQVVDLVVEPGTFAEIRRTWKSGDVIDLDLSMEPQLVIGHRRIEEVRNQVAIKRGPIVYCVETPDLPEGTEIFDVYLPSNIELVPEYLPDSLGGATILSGDVYLNADRSEDMYQNLERPVWAKTQTQFIPYFTWNNRGPSEMTVWTPIIWQ